MSKVLVPDYFERFHCKCGSCRTPCCNGWGINVDEREYFTLIGIDCSPRLRHKLDDAFVISSYPTEAEYASITPNYLEQCPMLDSDGLCLLQKEKGEKLLPLVCRVYPRVIHNYSGHYEICMSCSCEETVECLMNSALPLSFHETELDLPFDGISLYDEDPAKDALRFAVLETMNDSALPIAERIKKIGEMTCGHSFSDAYDRNGALESLLNMLKILCKRSPSIRFFGEDAVAFLADKTDKLEIFNTAEKHLYGLIPDLDAYAGRIISNHLMYEGFPYVSEAGDPDTVFTAFCAAVGILKLLCVCCMADSTDLSRFVDILSFANRFIEHSDYYKACRYLPHPDGHDVFVTLGAIFTQNR